MARDTAWTSPEGAADGQGGVASVVRRVGERLRAARESQGKSLEDMAAITRIGTAQLRHLEESRIEALPSRPYAIGYARAYARALGMDADMLVARFRSEFPEPTETFRAPVGIDGEATTRLPLLAWASAAIVAAIVLWNVAQRVVTPQGPATVSVAEADVAWTLPAAPTAPLSIGAPLPPPADQTVPARYETPGMAEYFAAQSADASAGVGGQITPVVATAPSAPETLTSSPVRAAFNPRGAVYGAAPQRSTVIIQARKPGFVIVRGRDEAIHFARQLAAGDAYRAPPVEGLSVEVSNPADFDLFRDGELQGPLPAPTSSLDKLAAPAPVRR